MGGGELMVVGDRCPYDDCNIHHHHPFTDEHDACAAGEWFDDLLENHDSTMSATEFFEDIRNGLRPWDAILDENSL